MWYILKQNFQFHTTENQSESHTWNAISDLFQNRKSVSRNDHHPDHVKVARSRSLESARWRLYIQPPLGHTRKKSRMRFKPADMPSDRPDYSVDGSFLSLVYWDQVPNVDMNASRTRYVRPHQWSTEEQWGLSVLFKDTPQKNPMSTRLESLCNSCSTE